MLAHLKTTMRFSSIAILDDDIGDCRQSSAGKEKAAEQKLAVVYEEDMPVSPISMEMILMNFSVGGVASKILIFMGDIWLWW